MSLTPTIRWPRARMADNVSPPCCAPTGPAVRASNPANAARRENDPLTPISNLPLQAAETVRQIGIKRENRQKTNGLQGGPPLEPRQPERCQIHGAAPLAGQFGHRFAHCGGMLETVA